MNVKTEAIDIARCSESSRTTITRTAYGISRVTEKEIISAKSNLIKLAKTPIEFVEAYFLIYLDANLEEIFFERIRTINFSKEEWKIILDKSKIFGLRNLESYAEALLEQL